jgi:opacity protein-like surface antigen
MKIRIAMSALALACTCAFSASASTAEPGGPYVAIGYDALWPTYGNLGTLPISDFAPSMTNGADVSAGWRFSRYYAAELNYAYSTGSRSVNAVSSRLSIQSVMADAFGYLPIGRSNVSTFATFGLGIVNGDAHLAVFNLSGSRSQTDFSGRAGAGIAWQLTDRIGARLMARYQWDSTSDVSGATEVTLGLTVAI